MQVIDGRPVYSATDLVGFLACEHLTNLDRAAAAGLVTRPMRADPEMDLIARRGFEHERRFLGDRRAEGLRITEIAIDGSIADRGEELRAAAAATAAALRRGDDLIYQATFFDGRWRGHADFLRRVDHPGELAATVFGDWSYEVWDTKLARHTKASAVLQLGLYTDLLAQVQARVPAQMHVALGGSTRQVDHLRVSDYAAYVRAVRDRFEAFVGSAPPVMPPPTRPDPVEHCEVCRWNLECRAARRAADDLSLVAGITTRQRRSLRERAVATRTSVAELELPMDPPLRSTSRDALERIRDQARIQVAGEQAGRVLHELLDPPRRREDGALEPNRGLLALPEPSPGDLFFDIEGDPFALEDGVDYLFGVIEPGSLDPADSPEPGGPAELDAGGAAGASAGPTFHAIWARDADGRVTDAAEKAAFEALIDLIIGRLAGDPTLHVYHYAPYEPTAVRRLMGRHGTRENEVDRLLRGDVFVDLFRVVRQGIRASVESYSIKRLEPLYGLTREVDLRDAGSSIVAFEEWLELGGEAGGDPTILERIEGYNRDDCLSNWRLRGWLEARRMELAQSIGLDELPRPVAASGDPPVELSERLARVSDVAARLTANVPPAAVDRTPEEQARWLLAQLLSWHRREAKSSWWRYFHLMEDLTDAERIEEPDALAGLVYVGQVGEEARSFIHRYRFPPQEHRIEVGRDARDPATGTGAGEVVAVDNATGTIDLKRARASGAPHPTALVPYDIVSAKEHEESLLRIGDWVADHGVDGEGPYRVARDLVALRLPRAGQVPGASLVREGEPARKAVVRAGVELDESYLAVQGPPGSGKTRAGAELIVDLVAIGRKVAVTANSHRVIGHLLDSVAERAAFRGVRVRIGQKPATNDEACTCPAAACHRSNEDLRGALERGEIDVAGGTTWVWSRPEFAGSVDVLVVDEAGQMSLANVLAVSPAGPNLVLLGDPQQLDQPLQGSHPPGAERSALAHLLGGRATMPPEYGLFLERTWRLHPEVCAFTSEAFYEGRLEPEPGRDRQLVRARGELTPLAGTGLRFVPVAHEGNRNESVEEADVVARLVSELVATGAAWVDDLGREWPIRAEDILVITPYNAQVRAIAEALPAARVGTVDKFQGQEAPVSIYSMATSSPDDAPRGMEFLYSLNRLNVATSRARCVAAVVASPELLRVRCRTPRQMQLANALCLYVEHASR